MTYIFIKEFNSFLNSLIGYLVVGVFLVAMGLLMWVFPESSVLDYGYADMDSLFSFGPYVLIFLVPAITMRSLAEEKKLKKQINASRSMVFFFMAILFNELLAISR